MVVGSVNSGVLTNPPFFPSRSGIVRSSPLKRNLEMSIYSDDDNEDDDNENVDPGKLNGKGQKRQKCTTYENESAQTKSAPPPVTNKSALPPVPSTPTPHRFDLKEQLPPPAGRSPPRAKCIKPFTPNRNPGQTPSQKKRIQGSSLLRNDSVPPPFSIAAALSGSLTSSVPKKSSNLVPASHRRRSSYKPSLDFKIYTDSPHEDLTNLMQHSTSVLDLSDDKEEKARKCDAADKEKENIPPGSCTAASGTEDGVAKNDEEGNEKMENADRNALGELNPADFATKEQLEADAEAEAAAAAATAPAADATAANTTDDAATHTGAAPDGNEATGNDESAESNKPEAKTVTKKGKKTGEKAAKQPKGKGRKNTAGRRKRNVAPPSSPPPQLETVAEEASSLSEDEKELSAADRSAISGWIQTGAPALPNCDILVA